MKAAIYPGTFDPVTKGHINIIERSIAMADRLVVGIAEDIVKTPLFSLEERIDMVKNAIESLDAKLLGKTIEVKSFSGLLVEFARSEGTSLIIRGLRAVSDFEYEFQLFSANSKLANDIETMLLPASESTHFISSSIVKEIGRLNGNVEQFVSPYVKSKIEKHFSK